MRIKVAWRFRSGHGEKPSRSSSCRREKSQHFVLLPFRSLPSIEFSKNEHRLCRTFYSHGSAHFCHRLELSHRFHLAHRLAFIAGSAQQLHLLPVRFQEVQLALLG